MRIASRYVHALNGRLRIKVAEVKNSPITAGRVEDAVGSLEAVRSVTANPVTGNVLVLYEPGCIGVRDIVGTLQKIGCLRRTDRPAEPPSPTDQPHLAARVAQTLAQATVEIALRQVVRAFL